MARPPILVIVLAASFVLLVVALLIGSFTSPEFPPYALTKQAPAPVGDTLVGPATYTLDASATNEWRRFDFARNAVVDGGSWDIAFERFHLIVAPGGGVVDLGLVPFDSVTVAPDSGYQVNEVTGRDTTNPGVGKWYEYSMLSHLLTSKHHVYAVRTPRGKYAKLEFLAYYCKDAGTACVTFRYAYQGSGDRALKR
ncbi:MAG TPA: HmuY family protein [Gemmatimonadales bacterium]|nr:HmuY family protein [Gemmatimonadales bacterium]